MIVVSDSIKNAYNKYTTQRKPYIKVGNNTYYIQNMDFQADCYDEGNIIGNAIAKILKFDIETEYVEELDKFELYDSIWTGNQYESVFLGTFKLYDEEGTDDFFSSVTAYDLLIKFNVQYDPSQMTYPSTIFGLLQNICSQAGVILENTSIVNGTQPLENELFVEGETLKTILNAICQISGTFGTISNDKLKLGLKGSQTITLNKSQISEPEFKRTTQNINQVVLGMTDVEGEEVKYPQDSQISGTIHKLTINNNPFVYTQALREAYIQNIYNQVNGFGYEAMSMKWEGLSYVELGDLLSVDGHSSIVLRYNIKSPKGLESTLEAPSIIDSSVEYYENSNSIENRQKRTEYIVDKANQRITQVVEEIGQYDERITKVEQTTEQISQEVSETINFIRNVSGNGNIILENANANDLKSLSIKGNISLLFGNDGKQYGIVPYAKILYPSSELFGKNMNLIIEYKEETQVIKLPFTYLNYISQDVCDEFILQDGKASIIRRVGINSNMKKYQLENEVIEDLGEFAITLKEGNPKLYLQCFDSTIYNASYMIKNEYTDTFATKVDLSSSINQASENINLSVDKKIEDLDIELKSEINLASNSILSEVNDVNNDLNAKLELKVDTENLVSEINASADVIKLESDRFILNSTNTQIAEDGTIACQNIDITGGNISINTDNLLNGIKVYSKSNNQIQMAGTFFEGTNNGQRGFYLTPSGTLSIKSITVSGLLEISLNGSFDCYGNAFVQGDLTVSGTKNRLVTTDNYGNRLLNAYETATPYFGDIGSNKTDENGYCKINIEDIFKETIELENYKVFIQECADGKLYVKKSEDYFEVIGTPNLEFDWEIKAIQKGYRDIRLKEAIIKEINNEEVINR